MRTAADATTKLRDRLQAMDPRVEDDPGLDEDDDRRRPWLRLIVALVAALLAVYLAGQTAARMWLEDLDERLLDAGAGTNAAAIVLEREQLEAFRSIAFSEGFAADLDALAVRAIEEKVTPIDANHGIPMIDIVDELGRVVFAFRGEGAIRPIYRERVGVDIVRRALAGERDEYGERFTDLIATEEGPLIATAGPVRHDDEIVGVVLLMTPLDELLSQGKNLHGADLTAYSMDRGDPLATTTPIRPRTFNTELRVELAQPENLPYPTRFKVAGDPQREQVGGLTIRHQTSAFLGSSLPDRSRQVALRVMAVAGIGLAVMAFLVGSVVHAWTRDRYLAAGRRSEREPLALPPGPPPRS